MHLSVMKWGMADECNVPVKIVMPEHETESQRPFLELARDHSGLALTALYLLLIAIGMMYEWWLFRRFNIDILLYAQAQDFLLVPFREPLVVIIALLPFPLYMAYIGGARRLANRLARNSTKQADPRTTAFMRKFMPVVNATAMLLWSFAFTAEYAEWVWKRFLAGKPRSVTVELASTPAPLKGAIVGTTSGYVFVYDRATNLTRIVAVENIASIVVEGKKPRK